MCKADSAGAGYAACAVPQGDESEPITTDFLVWQTADMLGMLVAHAVENAGCIGNAIAELRVTGPSVQLGYRLPMGMTEPYQAQPQEGEVSSRLSISLDAIAAGKQDLLSTTALLAAGITQAFGVPEPRELGADGTQILGFWHYDNERLEEWATANEVPFQQRRSG